MNSEADRNPRPLIDYLESDTEYCDAESLISALGKFRASGSNWAFRGQRRDWRLESALRRSAPWGSAHDAEKRVLSVFQRRAHHHVPIPEKGETLEWLALMRHYNAPTRLLDWTRSPYVATFFALADATQHDEPVIWAIDAQKLNCRAIEILHKRHSDVYLEDGPALWLSSRVRLGSPKFFDRIFMTPDTGAEPAVAPLDPFAMNERLAQQQGIFLCPTTLSESFESILTCMLQQTTPPLRPGLLRLRIKQDHSTIRIETLRRLYEMNITYATLFPDLDGFGKSLRQEAEFVSEPLGDASGVGAYFPHDF